MWAEPGREIEDVLDQSEDEDTDDGSPDPPIATRQYGSTDNDSGDGLELPQNACRRRCCTETWHIDECGYSHAQTLEDVCCDPNPRYIDRRIFRDTSIRADRHTMAA